MGIVTNMYVEELKKFCLEEKNSDIVKSGIIKGINPETGKVTLEKYGIKKEITVDELDQFDFDNFELIKPEKQTEYDNNLDILIKETKEILAEKPIESLIEIMAYRKIPTNLQEIKHCIDLKEEKLIDQALAINDFALDSVGKISINKAIKVVTDNSADNVIECIRDNKRLPISLSAYDITGKCIVEKENVETNELEHLINSSFNNILVYVEAAKLKNINFTEEQIKNAKDKYKTQVNDKLNILGLNKSKEANDVIDFESKKQEKQMQLELKPDTSLKGGFADIIILTMIVVVYAAIIINLIMKIK